MPPKSTVKRKSDAQDTAGPSKKARAADSESQPAAVLVDSIRTNKQGFAVPEGDDDIRQTLIMLADYAHALELKLADAEDAKAHAIAAAPPKKTREELEAAAEKIRHVASSGIRKLMTWKPSCKFGTAKLVYDGVCADPEVFGTVMGLDGPPKWKMKKFTIAEFQDIFGECEGKVRYDTLVLTGNGVTVRYSNGEFKISGTYGKYVWKPE